MGCTHGSANHEILVFLSNHFGSPSHAPGYVGADDPLLNIVVLLLVLPTLAVSGAFLAAVLARWKGHQFSWPKYLNVVGVMVGKGIRFVAIVLSVASQKTSFGSHRFC